MKKSSYKRKKPFLHWVPWWIWIAAASAVAFYLHFYLDSHHLPRSTEIPVIDLLDRLLHTNAIRNAGFALSAILALFGFSALFRASVRRRSFAKYRSLEALRQMPWQDFEILVGEAFRRQGFTVEETGLGGADGGIDLVLHGSSGKAIVQCKRWSSTAIGAPVVREMYGLMSHHKADEVKVVCVGKFTKAAHEFAAGKPIDLIGGEHLLEMLRATR